MGAAEDNQTHREVAEDARDEDGGVEHRDEDQGVVVVHLLGAQHHLQELGYLRGISITCHWAATLRHLLLSSSDSSWFC